MYFSYWVGYVTYRRNKKGLSRMLNHMAWMNVTFGVVSILLALFVLRGFRQEVSGKLHSLTGHIQVRPYTVPGQDKQYMNLRTSAVYDSYLKGELPNIAFLQPYALQAVLLKTKTRTVGVHFKGVQTQYQQEKGMPGLQEGRMIHFDSSGYTKECVLSTKVAAELSLSVGDTVLIHVLQRSPRYRKVVVVGLYRTALEELDEKLMIGDLRLIQRLNGLSEDQIQGVEIFLRSEEDIAAQSTQLYDKVDYGMQVITMSKEYPNLFGWFDLLDLNTYIFLGLIVVVAGFNMVALCVILTMERRSMIGTFTALGATQNWLRGVFFIRSLIWVFWGMLCGNLLAFAVLFLQKQYHFLPLDAENYAIDHVPMHVEWDFWLYMNVSFLLWLCVALYLPLASTMRDSPSATLRFR